MAAAKSFDDSVRLTEFIRHPWFSRQSNRLAPGSTLDSPKRKENSDRHRRHLLAADAMNHDCGGDKPKTDELGRRETKETATIIAT